MKTIVLPTDFSDNALNAIEYAFELFKREKNEYVLLHTYMVYQAGEALVVSMNDVMREQAQIQLDALKEKLEEKYGSELGVINTKVIFGDLVNGLRILNEDQKIDYVVMGTKGASGVKKVVYGSNTADVIKNVALPIITVPEGYKFTAPKNIVLANDYHYEHDFEGIETLLYIVRKYQSSIAILNVEEEAVNLTMEEALEGLKLHEKLEGINHTWETVINETVEEGIKKYVAAKKPDMLALIHHKRSFLEGIFHKSITKHLSFEIKIPMIILHD
ncbi:MAG: hypothetical protein Kow0079_06450 [Vicingaceae bacterium]